jgi:hypothetical protein
MISVNREIEDVLIFYRGLKLFLRVKFRDHRTLQIGLVADLNGMELCWLTR